MATLRKPKKLKMPKAPKANASAAVLKRHLEKVADVNKKNRQNEAEYLKEKKARLSLRKQIEQKKKK